VDLAAFSRRSFLGRLAVAPALVVPTSIAGAKPVKPTEPSRITRLNALFGELRRLVADEFPEFEVWGDILPEQVPSRDGSLHMAFLASCPAKPEPPRIEFAGAGLYEVNIEQWRKTDIRTQYVERVPKRHRLAGQFRFRSPDAAPGARWQYVPEAEFRLIRPA
jgi:hypothetical protein